MGMDWRMLVALIASFVAKENAIATLGILYGQGGDGLARTLVDHVSPAACRLPLSPPRANLDAHPQGQGMGGGRIHFTNTRGTYISESDNQR